jgi:2,5-dihydroxypyridine 5,6-dioxygenase
VAGEKFRASSFLATAELVELFTEHLRLCEVNENEHVLIHSDSGTYPHYPPAYMAAARALGADVFQIVHPAAPEKAVVDAWKRADLILDMSSGQHAYGHIMREALDAGGRILRMIVEEDTIRRLYPTQELRERVEAGQEIMENGSTMRITSPGGTDLTLYKEGRAANGIYSVADKPGRWDIWPAGMVCCAPHEDKGDGLLVLDVGDMMLVLRTYVRDKVFMEIEDGSIKKISGGFEAELLREWFGRFKDPNAYKVAHVGWGCERRADWMKPGQDNECYYANMQIAFGANVGIFPGAQTISRAHHDFPCRNNAYWVDELQIMEDGEFLIEELRYKGDDADATGAVRPLAAAGAVADFPRGN